METDTIYNVGHVLTVAHRTNKDKINTMKCVDILKPVHALCGAFMKISKTYLLQVQPPRFIFGK